MKPSLLDILLCPCCGAEGLTLSKAQFRQLAHGDEEVEEVYSGMVTCSVCQNAFPVEEYVLSFANLLPDDVRADGEYWGELFRWHVSQGDLGYLDLQRPLAGLLRFGVSEAVPVQGDNHPGTHDMLISHPLIRQSQRVFDLGCGTGRTSLYLARHGLDVVAVDPSLECVKMGKSYAVQQGVFLEYIAGASGAISFKPETFDTVFAFHSLHHVPKIEPCLAEIRTWLRLGGCLAIDEHIQDSAHGSAFQRVLTKWFAEEVLPPYMTASAANTLPPAGVSRNEGAGQANMLAALERTFHIEHIAFRYVFLDSFGDLYYFRSGRSPEATSVARDVVNILCQALNECFPEEVEYVILIGQKKADMPRVPQQSMTSVRRDLLHLFRPRSVFALCQGKGTAWYWLPCKAAHIFWYQGPAALLGEVRSYCRWILKRS